MLKEFKLLALAAAKNAGISTLMLNSRWRRNRLLIIGYHGFSQDDEHIWDPQLYMSPDVFRGRLQYLRDARCNVLPLAEGLRRLYAGTLPERSIVLTIDDGTYDAYKIACPMLAEFGYPATVYLTTYYAEFQRPVFDVMCGYLLWKAPGKTLSLPEIGEFLLSGQESRSAAVRRIKEYAIQKALSGQQKDALLELIADRLSIDYADLCRRRILHCMTPEEARELSGQGFDIELHTHRHRVSRRRERFLNEIEDNERCIGALRDSRPRHFCYPGGVFLPEVEEALRGYGIESAATCWLGLAEPQTTPLQLPRLIDTNSLTLDEFSAWVSGVASLLPRRKFIASEGQIVD